MREQPGAILEYYPLVARPLGSTEALGNAGGMSGSRFWRYRSGLGTLLLRAWPMHGPPRARLELVHGWLAAASDLGFLAVPVRGLDGRTVQETEGLLWEMSPWLPGRREEARPPGVEHVREAFRALAAFHARLSALGTPALSPGLLARRDEIAWLESTGFAQLRRAIAPTPPGQTRELAELWLMIAAELVVPVRERLTGALATEVACQPCLRDVRPEHFLFEGERVTGLIDYGAMGVDSVATDLARLASDWLGEDRSRRDAAFAAYTRIRPLDAAAFRLVEEFEAASDLLIGGHWVRWHYLEDRPFEDPGAVVAGLAKGVERVTRLARSLGRGTP